MKSWIRSATIAVGVLALTSCSSDIGKSSSPIALIASNSQILTKLDLLGGTGCDQNIATVHIQAIQKNPESPTSEFNQVRLTSYRVSYVRTDGGKLIPAPFTRTMDSLVTIGQTSEVTGFKAFETGALSQAPFAALIPSNGGRDPDTGLSVIRMDVILDIYGTTLAGEKVSAQTRLPLEFCYDCNGCA